MQLIECSTLKEVHGEVWPMFLCIDCTPNVTSLATSPIGSSPAGSLKTVTIGGYTYTVTILDLAGGI